MNNTECSVDDIDRWQDQIHDLRIDLRRADDEAVELQRRIDELEKEVDLHGELTKKMAVLHEKELDSKAKQIALLNHDNSKLKEDYRVLSVKFLRATAGLRTVALGNMEYFKTTKGEELLSWAHTEIVEYQQKLKGA